jgi:hypothetical protein
MKIGFTGLLLTICFATGYAASPDEEFKAGYQSMTLASCLAKTPIQGKMTEATRSTYCHCASLTIVASHTVSELKALDTFPASPAAEKKVSAILVQCAAQATAP